MKYSTIWIYCFADIFMCYSTKIQIDFQHFSKYLLLYKLKMKNYCLHSFLIVYVLFCFTNAYSQQSRVKYADSLENVLKTRTVKDTISITLMLYLEQEFIENNSPKLGSYVPEIIRLSTLYNYKKGLANVKVVQSMIASRKPDFPTALSFAHEALKIALTTNAPPFIIYCYMQLGGLQLKSASGNDAANFDKAIGYFSQALALALQTNNKKMVSITYQNIALAYLDINKPQKALDVLYKSRKMLPYNTDLINEGYTLNLIGRTLNELKQYDKALVYLKQGEDIAEKVNSSRLKVIIYYNLGTTYISLNRLDKAESYFFKSYQLTRKENKIKALPDLEKLAEISELRKDYKKALMYNKQFIVLKDSLTKTENDKAFLDLEKKYETSQKEAKIKALQQEQSLANSRNNAYLGIVIMLALLLIGAIVSILVINNTKQKVDKANKERDRLFSIVAHDLRSPASNLRRITSTIQYVFKKNDIKAQQQLSHSIEQAAMSLYSLVDNMLNWSLLQQNKAWFNPISFVLSYEVTEVLQMLSYKANLKNIKLTFDDNSHVEVFADRMFTQTIIRNLVDNAIKFTPENGSINIEISFTDHIANLIISDTGIGVPKETQNLIFNDNAASIKSQNGTQGEQGTGVGLYLCYELAKMNKGELKLLSSSAAGSTFSLSVPLFNT